MIRTRTYIGLAVLLCTFLCVASSFAAEDGQSGPQDGSKSGLGIALTALGAGLALGLSAIGTGIAQSRIGAAGIGAIAERPESIGTVILFIAIPETLVIFGFVMGIILLFAT